MIARTAKSTNNPAAVPNKNHEVWLTFLASAIRKGELIAPTPQTEFRTLSEAALDRGFISAVLRFPAGVVIPWPTPRIQIEAIPRSQGPEESRIIPDAISSTPRIKVSL